MKTSRHILIAAAGLLLGLSSSVLARPKVNLNISLGGRPGFNTGYCTDDRRGSYRNSRNYRHRESNWGWRNYRPYRQTIIFGSGYWYDSSPDYYVVTSPVVIEKQTVVYSTTVQPQQFDDSTIQMNLNLQRRKSELLGQLQASDKELRMGAIKELAGFSFDDNVRAALENILLSDPDPELRAEAADAFGEVKNTGALDALKKARVEDPSTDVRRAADEAIKNIEGE
jgi:hypothetical protein